MFQKKIKKNKKNYFTLQVYSDFILEKQPTSLEDVLEAYKKISKNLGEKSDNFAYASPKSVKLAPLTLVKKNKMKAFIINQII